MKKKYLIEEINQNELMSKIYKKVFRVFNYIEYLLTLISTVTECISISAFASLVGIPIGITSSAIGLKICVITVGIKKCKSMFKKKKKKHDKILLLAKSKLNGVINISHDQFVLVNNVPKEFYDIKEISPNNKLEDY